MRVRRSVVGCKDSLQSSPLLRLMFYLGGARGVILVEFIEKEEEDGRADSTSTYYVEEEGRLCVGLVPLLNVVIDGVPSGLSSRVFSC